MPEGNLQKPGDKRYFEARLGGRSDAQTIHTRVIVDDKFDTRLDDVRLEDGRFQGSTFAETPQEARVKFGKRLMELQLERERSQDAADS